MKTQNVLKEKIQRRHRMFLREKKSAKTKNVLKEKNQRRHRMFLTKKFSEDTQCS